MGAERLQHRVRGVPRRRRSARRPARPAAGVLARPGAVHARLRAVRGGAVAEHADRSPASCRRRARRCWCPSSLAIVLESHEERERMHAVALWAAVAALAAGIGPPLGGLLITASSWRLVFLVNIPVGLLALVPGPARARGEPRARTPAHARPAGWRSCSRWRSPRSCWRSSRGRNGAGAARAWWARSRWRCCWACTSCCARAASARR